MAREQEVAAAGGEIEADRRLTNCELVLTRRIGKTAASAIMSDISTERALTGLEALLRQTRKHYASQGGE